MRRCRPGALAALVITGVALVAPLGCGKDVDRTPEYLTVAPKPTPTGTEAPGPIISPVPSPYPSPVPSPWPSPYPSPIPTISPVAGVCGNLYDLTGLADHCHLPDFSALTPIGHVELGNFDIPCRTYQQPIPGVPATMREWYGIQFHGEVQIALAGRYRFKLKSDDGSQLWINGVRIVDHDGLHSMAFGKRGHGTFEPGWQKLRLDYFQGPKHEIGLQLFWKLPGQHHWVIVPPEALRGFGHGEEVCL